MEEDQLPPANLPVAAILNLCCPVTTPPWECEPGCLKGAVHRALKARRFAKAPVPHDATLDVHAERIAWLMTQDRLDPIDLEVGIPWMPTAPGGHTPWPISDGNHRLAAAILRGDTCIEANIGGCLRSAYEMMDLPVPDFVALAAPEQPDTSASID